MYWPTANFAVFPAYHKLIGNRSNAEISEAAKLSNDSVFSYRQLNAYAATEMSSELHTATAFQTVARLRFFFKGSKLLFQKSTALM